MEAITSSQQASSPYRLQRAFYQLAFCPYQLRVSCCLSLIQGASCRRRTKLNHDRTNTGLLTVGAIFREVNALRMREFMAMK